MNDIGTIFVTYLFLFGVGFLAYYLDMKWRARIIASEMEKVLRKLEQERIEREQQHEKENNGK